MPPNVKRARGLVCRNLFAAPKSADSYHDSSQPADSAFLLEGQQDATRGAVNWQGTATMEPR
jgi:hypothetical protein